MSGFITNNGVSFFCPGILTSSSSFTPTQLSGLAAWYRADQLITQSGGIISGWGDSSGSGDVNKNLSQSTSGDRPTYIASDSAYNNHPTVNFIGANTQFLYSGTWTTPIAGANTIFIIGNDDGNSSIANGGDGEGFVDTYQDPSNENILFTNTTWGTYVTEGLVSTIPSYGLPTVVAAVFNGASSAIYINSSTANITGSDTAGGLTDLVLGNYNQIVSGVLPGYLTGKIAEVIIYSRALTSTEITKVMTYAQTRYISESPITITDPTGISNLQAWYRADKGITQLAGVVSGWADQSGTGDSNKNLAQSSAPIRPTFNSTDSSYNNQPTLTFTSVAHQYLLSGTWTTDLTDFTLFIVGNDDGTNAYYAQDTEAQVYDLYPSGGHYAVEGSAAMISTVSLSSSPKIFGILGDGSGSALYISAQTAKITGNIGDTSMPGFQIGLANSHYLNGKIAEAIIYGRALQQNEINAVLAYLGTRYNIVIGL